MPGVLCITPSHPAGAPLRGKSVVLQDFSLSLCLRSELIQGAAKGALEATATSGQQGRAQCADLTAPQMRGLGTSDSAVPSFAAVEPLQFLSSRHVLQSKLDRKEAAIVLILIKVSYFCKSYKNV